MSYVDTVVNNSLPALAQPYFLWPEWVQNLFGLHLGWTPAQTLKNLWQGYLSLLLILPVLALALHWYDKHKLAKRHWLAFFFVLFTAPLFDLPFIYYETRKGCSQLTGVQLYQRVSAQGYYDSSWSGSPDGVPEFPEWRKADEIFYEKYQLGSGPGYFHYVEVPESKKLSLLNQENQRKIIHRAWRKGQVMETLLEYPLARYVYEDDYYEHKVGYSIWLSESRITDRQTNKMVAHRMNVRINPGFLESITIGAFGNYKKDCPTHLIEMYPESSWRKNAKILPVGRRSLAGAVLLHYPPELYKQLVFEEE